MLCFLSLAACAADKIAEPIKPPAGKLICVEAEERPELPAYHEIDWPSIVSVDQARAEHEKYVASVYARNGVTAGYILRIEGRLHVCASNMQWLKDWFEQQ